MNALDWVILSIIFISGLYSFFRGAIREIFSLLSLVVGFFLAVRFYHVPAHYLTAWLNDLMLRNVIGFVLIFIGISLIFTVIGIVIRKIFVLCKIGALDRVLGMLLGFIKGFFVGIVIVFVLIFLLSPEHTLLLQSRLSFYLVKLGKIPLEVAPNSLTDRINSKKEALLDYWARNPIFLEESISQKPEVVTPEKKHW